MSLVAREAWLPVDFASSPKRAEAPRGLVHASPSGASDGSTEDWVVAMHSADDHPGTLVRPLRSHGTLSYGALNSLLSAYCIVLQHSISSVVARYSSCLEHGCCIFMLHVSRTGVLLGLVDYLACYFVLKKAVELVSAPMCSALSRKGI